MRKLLLIVTFFLLSGCDDHCIKPESLSGLREKLDVVSTEQKWVDSGVNISDRVKVTEINIVPSKINFCPNQYEDFAIRPGKNDVTLSKFALKAGDSISFSVIGSKVCRDKEDNAKIRYVKIDKECSEKEDEYFAHVLNQNECQKHEKGYKDREGQYMICPNKYVVGNTQWLNGKEYWSSDFSKSDQDEKEKEIKNIVKSIKQQERNIDCNGLSDSQKGEIDTHILNLLCGRICKFSSGSRDSNCVYVEYNSIEGKIFQSINNASGKSDVEAISKILIKEKQIKTDITLLSIKMDDENFERIPTGGICTSCDHKMENDHQIPSLTFSLCSRNDKSCYNTNDKGGFNIRVTKNHSLENSLYISVSDKFPEHKPGEDQRDIPVDISKVHDIQYMEGLKDKLKDKNGTIYYGIRNHGCDYKENEGQFSISLTTKEPPVKTFSAIYNFFDEKVKTAFFGSGYKNTDAIHSDTSPVKSLYESFIKSSRTNTIRSTIISLLVLYIVLYTLYYFFGLTHVSIYEFLIICVKIGIITQLLQDNSWDFFYNNAFSIFINTPKQLIGIANFRDTTSNVFEFLDLPLNRFLSAHSVLLIVSLIFSGPLGIVSFCLVIWGLITVVLAIFDVLFSFITSIAIVALLLSLAPIFIICLLFAYTRQMFHNWVKNLARFAIHPIVLLIFISLISQVMDYIIYSVFDFEVCSTCILSINLKIFNPCIFYGYASKYAPNITAMMAFVILGHAMKALVEASSAISDSLFGVYVQNEPGKEYQQSLMGTVGLDEQSVQRRGAEGGRGGSASQQSGTSRPQIPQETQRSTPQIPQPGKQQ
ncbi:type IV secretion system protein [Wolbachia endosymbiont of Atemnus politus]|uniref:type IV secretion system protein n=1 Tax=Wolbachia endosymbiont of Atemnus politus TaxID=2682840 RepID=UPI0015734B67|nr:type IV secretion system protein [Wolbachia endosymbiont of Atemnus politus]NSM56315.1 type IV secretion system protein [Wolbachia endosymbiont of Atemnus politus]NSX83124.1 conjugal transfer protein TrbL [Wolbachia endosymbiont of Atemnus politus]